MPLPALPFYSLLFSAPPPTSLAACSEEYPQKPPKIRFVSPIYHPNVYADGSICLDILQNAWASILDVAAVLTSIQSLLSDPNPNSPANSEAARLYVENRVAYDKKVAECVEASWVAAEAAGAAGE